MPPNPFAMNQSSGQSFTQRIRPGKAGATSASGVAEDWSGAIEDIQALSARMAVMGRDSAVALADSLTHRTKEAIRNLMPAHGWIPPENRNTGEPFEFSKGRLAAAWGSYTPNDIRGMVDEDGTTSIQQKHEQWAEDNGVAGEGIGEGRDIGEETILEMGALTVIKRMKGNAWTVEVGTFLPYAPLANDGGDMMIHPYGNPRVTVRAHWEGVHFMETGVAAAEAESQTIIEGSVQAALSGQVGRRKVANRG